MRRAAFLCAFSLFFCGTAAAQGTGTPPFGSYWNSPSDTINNQNLNIHIALPVTSSPGRSLGLSFAMTYDSLAWQNIGNHWKPASGYGWIINPTLGTTTYSTSTHQVKCSGGAWGVATSDIDYAFTDPTNTVHAFSTISYNYNSCTGLQSGT